MTITKHQFEQVILSTGAAAAGLLGHAPLGRVAEAMAVWFFMRPDVQDLEMAKKYLREYLAEIDDKGYVKFPTPSLTTYDIWPKGF